MDLGFSGYGFGFPGYGFGYFRFIRFRDLVFQVMGLVDLVFRVMDLVDQVNQVFLVWGSGLSGLSVSKPENLKNLIRAREFDY